MYLTLIFLPGLSCLVSGIFGKGMGIQGSRLISTGCIIISAILSIFAFIDVAYLGNEVSITLIEWINIGSFQINWSFYFDALTVSMVVPVLVISSLVHLYATGYMSHDPHQPRFFSYLSMFTFFMIILVTADNYLVMFVGWEMIGVASYLLISFWYMKLDAIRSGLSAILMNRFGDTFFILGMFTLIWTYGSLDFGTIFPLASYTNETVLTITSICFILAAMAKSVQLGLHNWLPFSMNGPTPVSSLLHAATLVTAGIYLLLRSSAILEYSSTALIIILWLGALTTFTGGLMALFSNDIKRIIAFSTMSQLGNMFIAMGLSAFNLALFHLFTHAFFKALLFMSAGSIIHSVIAEYQDIRKFGGLLKYLPFTYTCILIASLSLMAVPGLAGYYSKDIIIESAYGTFCCSGLVVYWLSTLSAMFTGLYSIRLLYYTFFSQPLASKKTYLHVHEPDLNMGIPMFILAIASIFIGYLTKDFFIGLGSNTALGYVLFTHPDHLILPDTEFGSTTIVKIIPLILSIGGSALFLILLEFNKEYLYRLKTSKLGRSIHNLFSNKLYLDIIYGKFVYRSGLDVAGILNKVIDKGALYQFGPQGSYKSIFAVNKHIVNMDSGAILNYALYILIGFITFIAIFFVNVNYSYSFINIITIMIILILGKILK